MCREPRGAVSAAGLKGGVWDIGPGSGSTFSGAPGRRISWGPPTVWWLVVGGLCPCHVSSSALLIQSSSTSGMLLCYRYNEITQYPHGHWQNVCSLEFQRTLYDCLYQLDHIMPIQLTPNRLNIFIDIKDYFQVLCSLACFNDF